MYVQLTPMVASAEQPPNQPEMAIRQAPIPAPDGWLLAEIQQYRNQMFRLPGENDPLETLHPFETERQFTCTDGRTTGYMLVANTNAYGPSLFLHLRKGDGIGTEVVFPGQTTECARIIAKNFNALPANSQTADQLRALITEYPELVLNWARNPTSMPLPDVPVRPEPVKIDYTPYQAFQYTLPLADGKQLDCTAEPEPGSWRVHFKFSEDGGRTYSVFPVDARRAENVLKAIQTLPNDPTVITELWEKRHGTAFVSSLLSTLNG